MIPDLKMSLIYKNSKAVFTANINSVFDICWYTLSRFIATNSGSLNLDLSIDTEDFRSTHIGVCRSYGRYMQMKSNRQLYYIRDHCQRDRNRRKQKDIFSKEKEKTPINNAKIHFIRNNVKVSLFICNIRIWENLKNNMEIFPIY